MKRDTIIKSGMNLIPYVGSSLATLYFDEKQEKRFERLERFYQEIKKELDDNPFDNSNFTEHNKEELENLIEDIHNRVELETRKNKKKLLRNFFIQTIEKPIKGDFDIRKTYLNILDSLSELECELLAFIANQQDPIQIKTLTGADIYILFGGVNKLISYGILETRRGSYIMNGSQDENLDDFVYLSDYGNNFVEYVKIK